MSAEVQVIVDPLTASLTHLLAVSFPKNSSSVYPMAVNLSRNASKYEETRIEGKLHHFVAFARTQEDAARALALLDYVRSWKGAQVFAGGRMVTNVWNLRPVIECFLQAASCSDYTAHCHKVIDDPFKADMGSREIVFSIQVDLDPGGLKEKHEIDRYIFPCEFLRKANQFRFQSDHPAKLVDQLQAGAVSAGCVWCPFFAPSSFKKNRSQKGVAIYKGLMTCDCGITKWSLTLPQRTW